MYVWSRFHVLGDLTLMKRHEVRRAGLLMVVVVVVGFFLLGNCHLKDLKESGILTTLTTDRGYN